MPSLFILITIPTIIITGLYGIIYVCFEDKIHGTLEKISKIIGSIGIILSLILSIALIFTAIADIFIDDSYYKCRVVGFKDDDYVICEDNNNKGMVYEVYKGDKSNILYLGEDVVVHQYPAIDAIIVRDLMVIDQIY